MAVYGSVCHQKNIIWTEASEVHIIFFIYITFTVRKSVTIINKPKTHLPQPVFFDFLSPKGLFNFFGCPIF
jgi:hypothetical protein